METRQPIVVSWSGGKDSAMALWELQRADRYDVAALVTTVTEGYDRISMHGVRRVLLERQAEAIGVPLEEVWISPGATNREYEANMSRAFRAYRSRGVMAVAFGDLFLEDIRRYRERLLDAVGIQALFPVWGRNTQELARAFIALGFRAVVVCVDPRALDRSFAGRLIDAAFLRDLPPQVDPCGERGEFHSFVFDGPIFRRPIDCAMGAIVQRDGFRFCDLAPAEGCHA